MSKKYYKYKKTSLSTKSATEVVDDSHTHEMWKPYTLYAFSINPKDELQGDQGISLISRAEKYKHIIKKLTSFLKKWDIEYELYPELSTPDPTRIYVVKNCQPRLHFHGYIKIKYITQFYLYCYVKLVKLIGIYKIKEITDDKKWRKYISKDSFPMKQICNELGIKYQLKSMAKTP